MNERVERGRKEGWVYFLSDGSKLIKIGWARDPDKRIRLLQTGTPKRLRIIGVIPGTLLTESLIHKRFSHARVTGEWFDRKTVIGAVSHLVETLGFKTVRAANSRTIPEGNRVGEIMLVVPEA
jgi:hypothetical protein